MKNQLLTAFLLLLISNSTKPIKPDQGAGLILTNAGCTVIALSLVPASTSNSTQKTIKAVICACGAIATLFSIRGENEIGSITGTGIALGAIGSLLVAGAEKKKSC